MAGSIEEELKKIKQRNTRVEADKAWETSNFRKGIIAIFTYMFAAAFLVLIKKPNPYLNALIPVIGFWFSTLVLPPLKKIWIERYYKR